MTPLRATRALFYYLLMAFLAFVFLAPFLWMVLASLKTNIQLFTFPPRLIPSPARWDNYVKAWTAIPLGRFYLNRIREAVGVDLRSGAVDPAFNFEPDRLEAAIGTGRPVLLTAIGVGSVVVLTWLMVFKPF